MNVLLVTYEVGNSVTTFEVETDKSLSEYQLSIQEALREDTFIRILQKDANKNGVVTLIPTGKVTKVIISEVKK